MTPVFIDTSYLLALVSRGDQHRERALKWNWRMRGPLLTTEYVLIEFGDCCSSTTLRTACAQSIRVLKSDPAVQIVDAAPHLFRRGVELFESRVDKKWGLTDCISFGVMAELGLREALSSDRHFEQAGFVPLLRSDPPEVDL